MKTKTTGATSVHRESLVAPSLAWLGEDTRWCWPTSTASSYPFDRGTAFGSAPTTRWTSRNERLDEPFNDMEGRSDLYRLEADHELNDDWKAHFGYSWNRETYDASQVRVTAMNRQRHADPQHGRHQGAISRDRSPPPALKARSRRACSMTCCSASMTSTARSTAPT
jgi:iron complex outermembrane receptor protein